MLLSNLDLLGIAQGGVAKLRELIMTLAVQGKLVPQDAADEPAELLLQKIRNEKDQLIAAGKIKRHKQLAELASEEIPFALPQVWEWARLGAVASKLTDGSHNPPRDSGAGFPMLSSQNVWEGGIIDFASPTRYVSESDFKTEDRRTTVSPGDVLLTIVASLGRSAVVPIGAPRFVLQRSVAVIRTGLNPEFCSLFLRSPVARAFYDLHGKGTAQKGIYLGKLGTLPIPVPPLPEQSRIVSRVEELMRLCDALEAKGRLEAAQHAQLVSTLLGMLTDSASSEELAENWHRVASHIDLLIDRPEAVDALEQTILQLAVRGLLVPQDSGDEPASTLLQRIRAEKDRLIVMGKIRRDRPLAPITDEEAPFQLPRGWQWVRFDELIHPLKPIAYGVLVPGPDLESGVPFVRIADLSLTAPPAKPEKTIHPDVDAQFQRTRLAGGEILMGVVGSIGKLGVAPSTWAGANIARAICRIVPADDGLNNFVLFLLQTHFMQASFAGDTRTLAQPTLNVGLIRQALTPIPPPAEQSRIVARVEALRRVCANLRERLSESQATLSHLAHALVDAQTFNLKEGTRVEL